MLLLNDKITLIVSGLKSGEIYVWDGEMQQWTKPYPLIPMAYQGPGCASYQHYLIVAEREPPTGSEITRVQILDTSSGQWYKATPMHHNGPMPYNVQSVIIGKTLYLSYSKSILSVSLPTLISRAIQENYYDMSIWKKLPNVPFYDTTLFSIGNMLLTAGGSGGLVSVLLDVMHLKSIKPSADIYLLNPHNNQWVKVGELPAARWGCACTVLPSGKLLVAGGSYGHRGGQYLSTVYIATISRPYF